jgi:hypothetical protein
VAEGLPGLTRRGSAGVRRLPFILAIAMIDYRIAKGHFTAIQINER